jgi:lipopolysaccharide/colanic/teichoic acid biosynthesis glycosyltransferase
MASDFYRRYGKRALDLALTIPALALLLLLIALVVRTTLGAPVLFRQVRPGLHGRHVRAQFDCALLRDDGRACEA